MEYKLNVTQLRAYAENLKAGDRVILSGKVFTSRDAAHKRITEAIENHTELPYDLKDAVIYYAGPTPAPAGLAVGSCGPTTSGRMDVFAPLLLDKGVVAMVGKGERSDCKKQSRLSLCYRRCRCTCLKMYNGLPSDCL